MDITLDNFGDYFEPGDKEFGEMNVKINEKRTFILETAVLSEKKEEIKLGDLIHTDYEGICTFCDQDVEKEEICSFAMNDSSFREKLIDTIHENILFYTPLEDEKAKVVKFEMNNLSYRQYLFLDKEHDAYWYAKGEGMISFNDTLYPFDIIASFDNERSFIHDETFFPKIEDEDVFFGKKGAWRIYENIEEKEFFDIPRITDDAIEELKQSILELTYPCLELLEQKIKDIEFSSTVPLIDNVVVINMPNNEESYHFTFSIEGHSGTFDYMIDFMHSKDGFKWEKTFLSKNGSSYETYPVSYQNHIFEQCRNIVKKYDKEWRIKMMMEPHEHQYLFPLFQPAADYQMEKKKIDFRYQNI